MHGPGRESLVYKVGAYDEPELLRHVLDKINKQKELKTTRTRKYTHKKKTKKPPHASVCLLLCYASLLL
jgi:hypothetical protein